MSNRFSKELQDVIDTGRNEAMRLGSLILRPEHIFLALLRDVSIVAMFKYLNVNIVAVKNRVETLTRKGEHIKDRMPDSIPMSSDSLRELKLIYIEAMSMNDTDIKPIHLFLILIKNPKSLMTSVLKEQSLEYPSLKEAILKDEARNEIERLSLELAHTKFTDTLEDLEEMALSDMPEDRASSDNYEDPEDEDSPLQPNDDFGEMDSNSSTNSKKTGKKEAFIKNFGVDYSTLAKLGKLDPIVGREKEIARIVQILSRRRKNNPIILGAPGVGKTAIVEGIALSIANDKCPRALKGKRIVGININGLIAGTRYRGDFEARMKFLINMITTDKSLILFIDEFHTLMGAGGTTNSALDAANILKPALARGEFQMIGATTHKEYREEIEKDAALDRRLQKITLAESTIDESIAILNRLKDTYEIFHNVVYTPEVIKACVTLSVKYIHNRKLPDKAIDILDEVGAKVSIDKYVIPEDISVLERELSIVINKKLQARELELFEDAQQFLEQQTLLSQTISDKMEAWRKNTEKPIVEVGDVEKVIKTITGFSVVCSGKEEKEQVLNLSTLIKKSVVGQDSQIETIAKFIKRSKSGISNRQKPIGSFIFIGESGVGKTLLAKTLSETLFGSKDSIVRLDMSEYMEKFSTTRLIGSPPGYVGYGQGGVLTEQVYEKPYSVVLFDEIEKAHPDVFNLLLQVLDEGYLYDSLSRKIDFTNTIIIMTSNLGVSKLNNEHNNRLGFASYDTNNAVLDKSILARALNNHFSIEFLNRIDEVIYFEKLNKESMLMILDKELNLLIESAKAMNIEIEFAPEVREALYVKLEEVKKGARGVKKVLQNEIEDLLSDKLLSLDEESVSLKVVFDKENNLFVLEEGESPKKAKSVKKSSKNRKN